MNKKKTKNKKILGIPIAFVVVGLLVIGGASAALVSYLSNTAEATVEVESPMSIQFANIGAVDGNGGFSITELWTDSLVMAGTTGLSTSTVGVEVVNNADVAIEGKWLQLTVSNSITNVDCDDLSSLMFWDTATPTQIANGYQQLAGVGLCEDEGDYVVYNIDINSLGAGQTFRYPVELTFGLVAPADYTFSAILLDSI